jgi:dTDP-4-dehydrorhamnose 3,5-epimerase
MPFTEVSIPGLVVFEPAVFADSRGFFFESYNEKNFRAQGLTEHFVQDNQSKSEYGVVRGLHYQLNPFAQTKLVRVLVGKILDVAVDIRKNSPTYGQVFTIELSAENKKQLFIPKGFAHGFSVLSETAEVLYKCDNFYNKQSEGGILLDDADLNIDWQVPADKMIISDKDKTNSRFADVQVNFEFEPK